MTGPARRAPWYPDEEWADIPGYEGTYWVSSHGRVLSRRRPSTDGGIMVPHPYGKGTTEQKYAAISLRSFPRKRRFYLHTLVMSTFVGPRPLGLDICHNDGDGMNARADNLRYDTHWANMLESRLYGTTGVGVAPRGESHKNVKLTELRVVEIRTRFAAGGISQHQLAREYGVDPSTINQIVANKIWTHITSTNDLPTILTRGEQVHNSKATGAKVREIRARYAAGGITQRELAAEYGLKKPTVTSIIARRTWAHIPPERQS